MNRDCLFLETGHVRVRVRIHPVVLFSMIDHWSRRKKGMDRVIGFLMGTVDEGIVEVLNCFPTPHTEDDLIRFSPEFFMSMLKLNKRVFSNEVLVGWYANDDIVESSVVFHELCWQFASHPPVHVVLDTDMSKKKLHLRSFVSSSLGLGGYQLGTFFHPVPIEYTSSDAESVGVGVLAHAMDSSAPIATFESLQSSLDQNLLLLERVIQYVNSVVDGSVPPNKEVGRLLTNSVSKLPALDQSSIEKTFEESMSDLLMVVYLANLACTQLAVAEKMWQNLDT